MVDGPVALAAAGVVKACENGDPLEQSGFAGAVYTDDDGDRPIEAQLEVIVQKRQTKRMRLALGDARWLKPNRPQVRRFDASDPRTAPSSNSAYHGKIKNKKRTRLSSLRDSV